MKCRYCKSEISDVFIDLGSSPPSNAYLRSAELYAPEIWYPLRALVCPDCWLVQTENYSSRDELFSVDYAYFSSYSSTWLAHAKTYVDEMINRFDLSSTSFVIEIGANDGYLLQYFKERAIPCLGIEPTKSTATVARQKGLDIIEGFFEVRLANILAREGRYADLMVANNVLAHVPDIRNFISGFTTLLKQKGVATFEFPHLYQLVSKNQFDTIYHEHYSYLSLHTVKRVCEENGLEIFDVEEFPTHGGSLRVFVTHQDSNHHNRSIRVQNLLNLEDDAGMNTLEYYTGFQEKANTVKNDFLTFLLDANLQKKKVIGYGAAAKGNTLINYAGIRKDLISFVVDANLAKQGKYLPGSRISIVDESHIRKFKPDYVIIIPWNISEEIESQLSYIQEWGGKFVLAVPKLEII